MVRPGGNPALKEHQFTTDRKEPCLRNFQVRVTESMWQALQNVPDNKEFVRQAIATALQQLSE